MRDVLVLGAGPAGRTLAAGLVERGLDVSIVASSVRPPLTNTFGVWVDHLHGCAVPLVQSWDSVHVVTTERQTIHRRYGLVDRDALADAADEVIGDRWVVGEAAGVGRARSGRDVVLADGRVLSARLVIDATGAHRVTAPRQPQRAHGAAQIALGNVMACADPPTNPTLMDFSNPYPDGTVSSPIDRIGPTFGYVLPTSDGVLVEETFLAVRPAVAPDVLGEAADHRRRAYGLDGPVLTTEHVTIPLQLPLPPRDARAVLVGVAGGLVHPATGYSFAAGVVMATHLVDSISAARDRLTDDRLVNEVHAAMWTPGRRRARALHGYGLDAVLRMDRATIQLFFHRFFTLDDADQSAYLDGLADVVDVRRTMLRLFRRVPLDVQRALVWGSPLRLLRAAA
jgi:lycopene beta-cyclase